MTDVTPATDEEVDYWRSYSVNNFTGRRVLSLITRIDAEKAARAEAEAERDALRDAAKAQIESERGHEHGLDAPTDSVCYFCDEPWPCPTERLRVAVGATDG